MPHPLTYPYLCLIHKYGIVVSGGTGERTLTGPTLNGLMCPLGHTGHRLVWLVRDHLPVSPLVQEEHVHYRTLALNYQTCGGIIAIKPVNTLYE